MSQMPIFVKKNQNKIYTRLFSICTSSISSFEIYNFLLGLVTVGLWNLVIAASVPKNTSESDIKYFI